MNTKNNLFIALVGVLLAVLVVAGGAGVWAYNSLLGDAQTASGPITAVPLVINTASATTANVATQAAPTIAASTATVANASTSVTTEATTSTTGSGLTVFDISPDNSQVSFNIYEELAGQPKTVVGTSNQVAGQLALNLTDLSQSQIGVIQVDARTLSTDSNQRNNAIKNFILNTNQYEYITFTPTQITGLSGSAQTGQAVTFQIAGNLTIRNVTKPVVFEVTVQGQNNSQLTGTATTTIQRSDYNLTIPSVPNVANVGQDVKLEINFTAQAAS